MRTIIIIVALFALTGCKTTYTLVEYQLMYGKQTELTLPEKKGERFKKRIKKSIGITPEHYYVKDSITFVMEPGYYDLRYPYMLFFNRKVVWKTVYDLK